MFKIIDYREDEWSDGFGGQIDYYYKIRNINTNEERWVNEYEFNNIRKKRIIRCIKILKKMIILRSKWRK